MIKTAVNIMGGGVFVALALTLLQLPMKRPVVETGIPVSSKATASFLGNLSGLAVPSDLVHWAMVIIGFAVMLWALHVVGQKLFGK